MAVLIVWGGLLLAEKVYEMVTEQQESQRRATAARIQQRRLRDEEEWQLTQPRTLLNEERATWTGPQPPQEYICPISLELMRDPVIIETGQTFDRESINSWFARGRRSCPLTNRPLQSVGVCSNTRLAREIALWKKEAMQQMGKESIDDLINKARDMAADLDISLDKLSSDRMLGNLVSLMQSPTVAHMAATVLEYVAEQDACDRLLVVRAGALTAALTVLQDDKATDEAQAAVCGMLVPLCRDVTIKPMVLEAELPACLVNTLTNALDAMVQVRAADALRALLKTASASTLMALQPLLQPLRALASSGARSRVTVRPYAIEALGYMAMNDELAAQLVEQGIVLDLMVLMVDRDRKLVEKAAFGVFCLAMHSRVLPKLRDAGAVQPLVTVAAEGQTAAQSYAAGALMYMAFHAACRGEIVSLGGVLPLVGLLSSSNRRCQGHAAGALSCLVEDPGVAALVGAKGGIPALVRMVDSQDSWLAELAVDTLCVLCKSNSNNQRRVLDAAALTIVTLLSEYRAVKETLFFSDSFMAMLQRLMSHPDEELAGAARQTAHALSRESVPPAMLRLNSFL